MIRSKVTLAVCLLTLGICAPRAAAGPDTSRSQAPTAPMDLTTGKTDATPLGMTAGGQPEAFSPQSPPQTVEGQILSVDLAKAVAVVRTRRDGDVKVGLPPNAVVTHDGHDGALEDLKVGDDFYGTVVTPNGVRALRIVDQTPTNPLVSIIGIPVLCLIAAWIWWYRVKTAPAGQAPKAQPRASKA